MPKIQSIYQRLQPKQYYSNAVYQIKPEEIVYCSNKEFDIYKDKGKIVSGQWDKLSRKFNEIDFFISYQDRLKGIKWEQLPYYQRTLKTIEKGTPKWSCTNKQELDCRCQEWDKLFNDINTSGYKVQSFLRQTDEITINIGRHGDLLFNNGRHRLTFAKLCNLQVIPVKITVHHSDWMLFKKNILNYAKRHNNLYAPLTHIDLQDIPSHYDQNRFNIIEKSLGNHITLLDIGSHWGYFCHKFEDRGLTCTAIENNLVALYYLYKLKRASNKNFTIIFKSVLALPNIKYDIVLALSIFHHFLKSEFLYYKFIAMLKSIDTKEMYFEPHLQTESQMQNAFLNPTPNEFIALILNNSCLKNCKLLGISNNNRPLYKLSRI